MILSTNKWRDKSGVIVKAHNEWSGNIFINDINIDPKDGVEYTREIMGCNGTIKDCKCTQRLIYALKIYQQMDLNESILVKWFKEEYSELMNDWTHFMSKHNDMIELEMLFKDVILTYHLAPCNLKSCPFAVRHHRGRRQMDIHGPESDAEDYEHIFYRDLSLFS